MLKLSVPHGCCLHVAPNCSNAKALPSAPWGWHPFELAWVERGLHRARPVLSHISTCIRDVFTCFFPHFSLVELERPSAYHISQLFPPHTFRPGDIAKIEENVLSKKPLVKKKASAMTAVPSSSGSGGTEGVIFKVRPHIRAICTRPHISLCTGHGYQSYHCG